MKRLSEKFKIAVSDSETEVERLMKRKLASERAKSLDCLINEELLRYEKKKPENKAEQELKAESLKNKREFLEDRDGPADLEQLMKEILLDKAVAINRPNNLSRTEYREEISKDEARRRNLIRISLQRRDLEEKIKAIEKDRKMSKLAKMIAIRDLRREISNL